MTSVSLMNKPKPPLVTFDYVDRNDATASISAGRHIAEPVAMIYITPLGDNGKTRHVAVAEEWIAARRAEALQGRYDMEWVERFENAFKAWKTGEEMPEKGTPIKGWQLLTPGEQRHIREATIYTVDDLAGLTDSDCLARGMGWMNWRDKAR